MVTQKYIARKLGVSPSLVSRALNGTADRIGAAEATVRKIRATARQLGYMPNAAARMLRGAKSQTIGVVIRDFDDPFLGRMIGELQELARRHSYALLLTGFDPETGRPGDRDSLLRFRLEALIVCGSDLCGDWLNAFLAKDIPVVQIGSDVGFPAVRRVETDDACGLELLLDYILAAGHRRLGFIGSDSGPHRRRRIILEQLVRQRGPTAVQLTAVTIPAVGNPGLRAMAELLTLDYSRRPSAVLAADDAMAIGALRAVHDAGMTVPHDLSLTGIDDIPGVALTIPALTTVRAPIGALVRAAFAMIEEEPSGCGPLRLKPELVVRESCGRFRSGTDDGF
ncbi:MAG: LacI family DNA-binding transcriptional regulator [Victivallales bacterium]|nr:LacI family DNA-binding transcriptional regulator [Victivallales bacterium]